MSGKKLRVLYPQYWGEFKVTSVVPIWTSLILGVKGQDLAWVGGRSLPLGVLSPDNCVIQGEAG